MFHPFAATDFRAARVVLAGTAGWKYTLAAVTGCPK